MMVYHCTMKRVLTLIIAFLVMGVASAENAVVVRDTNFLWAPSFDAGSVGRLRIGAEVNAGDRKGGWREVTVKNGGKSGWVRRYTLRDVVSSGNTIKIAQKSKTNSLYEGFASVGRVFASLFYSNVDENRQEKGNLTATVGIRGLDAQNIKQTKPDDKMLSRMLGYHEHVQSANSFAKVANLQSQEVDYLPKPQIKYDTSKGK